MQISEFCIFFLYASYQSKNRDTAQNHFCPSSISSGTHWQTCMIEVLRLYNEDHNAEEKNTKKKGF